jgi:hypothetical protein
LLVWDLRGIGWLFVTEVSGQNIGFIFNAQTIQIPRTCLSRTVIAEGKAIKSRGGQAISASGEDSDLAARIFRQVHIN